MGRGTRGAWSLLTLMSLYGVLAVLPMLAVGGYLLVRVAQAERSRLEERVQQIAASVADDVERELQRRLSVLQTLATSPRITQGDFAAFHAQARAAIPNDVGVLLHDATTRQQIVNTSVDYGSPLPTTGDPDTFDRVITGKRAEVSDVFVSLVSKAPAIDIAMPILRGGKVRYILKLALAPEHFRQILASQRLQPQWTLTILDRRGAVIARSSDHGPVAASVVASAVRDEAPGNSGSFHSTSLDQHPVIGALARVPSADWKVRVSVPVDVVQGPLNSSIRLLTASAIGAGLVTLALGVYFAARISKPLNAIAGMAQTLGRDETPLVPTSAYKEANMVAAALQGAAAELAKLRHHEQLVVRESSHRVKNILTVVQALVQQTLRGDQQAAARTTLVNRLGALARAQDALTNSNWQGASLAAIVEAELAPYAGRVIAEGPHVAVAGAMTQTFSLLLHELATNAAKHGALSTADGRVTVRWRVEGRGDAARLLFRWQESGGPPVDTPAQKGFGSSLLEGAVASQGIAHLAFAPDGLVYEVDVAMSTIAADSKVGGERPRV